MSIQLLKTGSCIMQSKEGVEEVELVIDGVLMVMHVRIPQAVKSF